MSNIRNIFEGELVRDLEFVFKQLEVRAADLENRPVNWPACTEQSDSKPSRE